MKKGFTKGLTCLGLAGVMFGAVAGMSGCDMNPADMGSIITFERGVYIVVTENNISTLHKGDIYTRANNCSPVYLKLPCREEGFPTSQYISYQNSRPDTSKYTDICEKCFEVFE